MKRISYEMARAMISAYCAKPGNEAGGNLHIVIEDANFEKHHVQFCLDIAIEAEDFDGELLARQLLDFTEEELDTLTDGSCW